MKTVDVREIETHITELLQQVRDDGEVIEITNRGEVVARVVPVRRPEPPEQGNGMNWAALDQLAAEIGKHLPEHVDAVAAIHDVRREL